jgi:hypothetical protein
MIIVNIYYLICLVVLYFVELACLDYAYCHLLQYITDNGSSKVSTIEGHEIIANLLLSKDSDLKKHCGKHNIRKINIRSLSDLLNVKPIARCNSRDVQNYCWTKYFDSDYILSASTFQQHFQSIGHDSIQGLESVRKQMFERMVELDTSLFIESVGYKGQPKCKYYLFTHIH